MPLPAGLVDSTQKSLFNLEVFAELVEYRPFGGTPLTVRALVERDGGAVVTKPGQERALTQKQVLVTIANRADWGRTSVNKKDTVMVPLVHGQAAVECIVQSVLYGDEVLWELKVGA